MTEGRLTTRTAAMVRRRPDAPNKSLERTRGRQSAKSNSPQAQPEPQPRRSAQPLAVLPGGGP